jgi:hypothetical protein
MTTTITNPAVLRVLRAQARTVAEYHRGWQRDLAASRADGATARTVVGAAHPFAHYSAGRKVLGDGVSSAVTGINLGAHFMPRLAALTEQLLTGATAPPSTTPRIEPVGRAPVSIVNIDPAALRLLRAQARTVAEYRRGRRRGLAACQSDGASVREDAGVAQAYAHHSAGRKVLGDGVSAAMTSINLGARRAHESAGEAFRPRWPSSCSTRRRRRCPLRWRTSICAAGAGGVARRTCRTLWRETVTTRRCCRVSQPGCGTTAAGRIGSSSATHRQHVTARRADRLGGSGRASCGRAVVGRSVRRAGRVAGVAGR